MTTKRAKKATKLAPSRIAKIKQKESEHYFYAGLMQPSYNSKQSTKHRTDAYLGFLNYQSHNFGKY